MDEVFIRTPFAKRILKKAVEKAVKKAIGRAIDIAINDVAITHKNQEKFRLKLDVIAEMSEAELLALVEQIGR